jgi:hypothetical protein
MIEYKFDLRNLWSDGEKIRLRTVKGLQGKINMYGRFVAALKKASRLNCEFKLKDREGEFSILNIPERIVDVVWLDYWQARAYLESLAGYKDSNLSRIECLLKSIWFLEERIREYYKGIYRDYLDDNWIFVRIEKDDGYGVEGEYFKEILEGYREGTLELKIFVSKVRGYYGYN